MSSAYWGRIPYDFALKIHRFEELFHSIPTIVQVETVLVGDPLSDIDTENKMNQVD